MRTKGVRVWERIWGRVRWTRQNDHLPATSVKINKLLICFLVGLLICFIMCVLEKEKKMRIVLGVFLEEFNNIFCLLIKYQTNNEYFNCIFYPENM